MQVYILDDYDCDCEIIRKNSEETKWKYIPDKAKIYEVPDDIVLEYEAINKRREELQSKILLIERQGPI